MRYFEEDQLLSGSLYVIDEFHAKIPSHYVMCGDMTTIIIEIFVLCAFFFVNHHRNDDEHCSV